MQRRCAHGLDAFDQLGDDAAPRFKLVFRPAGRTLERDVVGAFPFEPQAAQLTDRLEGREPGRLVRFVHTPCVRIECVPRLLETGVQRTDVVAAGRAELPCPAQFVEEGALVSLVAVEFEAGVADAGRIEPALNHLERSHLLGHEQDSLPVTNSGRDNIGDGLALAGPGRALDDHIAPAANLVHGQGLAAVTVDDVQHVGWRDVPVDVGVLGYHIL